MKDFEKFLVIDCSKRYEHIFNNKHQLKKYIEENYPNPNDFYSTHLIYEVTNIKKYWDVNDIKQNMLGFSDSTTYIYSIRKIS